MRKVHRERMQKNCKMKLKLAKNSQPRATTNHIIVILWELANNGLFIVLGITGNRPSREIHKKFKVAIGNLSFLVDKKIKLPFLYWYLKERYMLVCSNDILQRIIQQVFVNFFLSRIEQIITNTRVVWYHIFIMDVF